MDSERPKKKRPLWVSLLIGLAAYFVASWGVREIMHWPMWGRTQSTESILREACQSINYNFPIRVDEHTRWDSLRAEAGNTLVYKYTIVGVKPEVIDIPGLKAAIEPGILKNYCEDPRLKDFRKRSVTLKHQYFDESGKFLFEVEIGPKNL